MKSIVILGSTGSIGTQTLDVCRMHGFGVKALSASTNTAQLEKQAREFKPEYVCVYSESSYSDMKQRLADTEIKVLCGMEGLCELARLDCDIVVNSVVGMVGLLPTLTDSVNYLYEAGYIHLRTVLSKEPSTLADSDFDDLEAKLTAKGISLLAGGINDPCIKL